MVIIQIFDNFLYMKNVSVILLSKRYFTKKTIKNQFFCKKSYSRMYNEGGVNINAGDHLHLDVTSFEAHLEKNYILTNALELKSNTFFDVFVDNYGEVKYEATKETIDLIKLIDYILCSSGYFGKRFKCVDSDKLEHIYNNGIVLSEKTELPVVGLSIMNYTTKYNPLLQLVDSAVIRNDYLSKGIALHGNNAMLGVIKNDLDYARMFFFINNFLSYDLRQEELLKKYGKKDLNINELANDVTKKLFSKMPVTKIGFNNSGKTKEEFLTQLTLSWQNIKGKQ